MSGVATKWWDILKLPYICVLPFLHGPQNSMNGIHPLHAETFGGRLGEGRTIYLRPANEINDRGAFLNILSSAPLGSCTSMKHLGGMELSKWVYFNEDKKDLDWPSKIAMEGEQDIALPGIRGLSSL